MTPKDREWRKSSYSAPDGECVEVGLHSPGVIDVRDSKMDGAGPILRLDRSQWAAFLADVRSTSSRG